MFKLIIEDDEGKTTVVPLIRDEITIGRKEGNTIRLTERNVSRRHAKLVKQNSSVFIEDLGSYNGIKVNGSKIAGRIAVAEGDRIQIGDYLLALKMDRAQAAAGRAGADPFSDVKTQPMERPDDEPAAEGQPRDTLRVPVPVAGTNGAAAAGAAPAPTGATPPPPPPAATGDALPESALDMAPTTPVQQSTDQPARLVVLSSNFAGQEFLLDKAKLVIGRVDDNDIVVNHRSISRHHAAIVREHGHYNIVDLQSANGVRVNGEEYGKVELRRGDVIDLGHVRLRFVEPGEDFVFDRDATVIDISPGAWRGVSLPMAVFALLLALFLVGFIFRDKLFGHSAGSLAVDGGVATMPVGPAQNNPQPSDLEIVRALNDINQSLKDERWDDAIRKSDEVLKLRPDEEQARDRKQRAEAERKNQDAFNRYQKAVTGGDSDGAVGAYNDITEDSVYKERSRQTFARVRGQYIAAHLKKALDLRDAGKCADAKKEAEAVLVEDEANARANDVSKNCSTPKERPPVVEKEKPPKEKPPKENVSKRPPVEKEKPPKEEKEKPPQGGGGGGGDSAEADALAQQGLEAYVKGQYALSIELCNKALRINKRQPLALRILGAVHCKLKNREQALKAYNQAEPQFRNFIRMVCHSEGVELP
jgi:pSer/pThr/pTyr-binding forkhead associated (FHA) protein/tetratricopeptide (TPR) repeat protein